MTIEEGSGMVESVEKALDIVDVLKNHPSATLQEISQEAGLPKSTTHRHLSTLRSRGYVVFDGRSYSLGSNFLEAGLLYRENIHLIQEAKDKVDELAKETGEVAGCFIEEQGLLVYLYTKYGDNAVKVMEGSDFKLGGRKTLHTSASGKAILASLSDDRVDEIISHYDLPAETPNTVTDAEELKAELREIREQGYAYSIEEAEIGRNSIGVPIEYDSGKPAGAIGLTGPTNRLKENRLRNELPDILLGLSNEIELNLKYTKSSI